MAALVQKDPSALARKLLPSACILLAVFLGLARLPVIEWMPTTPEFALIAIYYWTLVRPARVPLSLLFALGLVVDSLSLTALGTHSLLFLAFSLLCRGLRDRLPILNLPVMWLCFAPWFLVLCLAYWAMASVEMDANPPFSALAGYWLVTVIAYPLLHLTFDRVLALSQKWKL